MEVTKLGMPIVHYPVLNHVAGSTAGGYMLSQALYWRKKMGGEFYKPDKDFARELAMNDSEFRRIKKALVDKQILIVNVKGVPRKSYYDVNEESLTSRLDAHSLVGDMPPHLSGDVPLTIQRLPETTTEITKDTAGQQMPEFLGKTALARLVEVYSLKFEDLYGVRPRNINWGLLGKLFKPVQQDYTEWQIAAMILLHFDWHGTSGEDQFSHSRLSERSFPLEWVPKNTNAYHVYLQNALGLKFDDNDAVKKWVVSIIKPLHLAQNGIPGQDTVA